MMFVLWATTVHKDLAIQSHAHKVPTTMNLEQDLLRSALIALQAGTVITMQPSSLTGAARVVTTAQEET